jgi:hypothetical protein
MFLGDSRRKDNETTTKKNGNGCLSPRGQVQGRTAGNAFGRPESTFQLIYLFYFILFYFILFYFYVPSFLL